MGRGHVKAWIAAAILVLVGLCSFVAEAQEDKEERRGRRELPTYSKRQEMILESIRRGEAILQADYSKRIAGEKEDVLLFAGNVAVTSRNFTLNARNVVIWIEKEAGSGLFEFDELDSESDGTDEEEPLFDLEELERADAEAEAAKEGDDSEPASEDGEGGEAEEDEEEEDGQLLRGIRQIYADEDVSFTQGPDVFHSDRMLFDLDSNRAIFINGYLRSVTSVRGRPVPLFLRASEIRQLGPGLVEGRDAALSTVGYGTDVFHVASDEVTVRLPETGPDGEPLDDEDRSKVSLERTVASSWGMPVLYLPSWNGSIADGPGLYFKRARGGISSQFGLFLMTEWGDNIKVGPKGQRKKVGEWTVRIDPYEERGVGLGFDIDYKAESGYGRLRSYYINDQADEDTRGQIRDPDTGKRTDIPIDEENRARFRLQYRHFLPFDIEGTFEASWISDSNFLREYFEREFKTSKEQETLVWLKKVFGDDQVVTLLQRNRLNDFQDQTEYQPQLEHRIIERPLFEEMIFGTNLYYNSRSLIGNVRQRPSDEAAPIDDIDRERVTRFDTVHRLSTPFTIGPTVLRPFFEAGGSTFSETRDEEGNTNRFTATAGAQWSTQFHRTFDAQNDLLEIDNLRHIVNPIVSYANRYANTVASDELIPHDDIEDRDKVEFFRLQVRNRLQTKRGSQGVVDFINFDTAINVFPNEDRDNDNRTWGNLENDLVVRLTERTAIFSESEWDWKGDEFEVLNTGISTKITKGLGLRTTYRKFRERSESLSAQLDIRLSEKWGMRLFERYDFDDTRNQDFGVNVSRFGAAFVFEVGVTHDSGDDDTRVSFNLTPSVLYSGPSNRRGSWDNELYFDDDDYESEFFNEAYFEGTDFDAEEEEEVE